jgi:hypothetical protein
VTDGYVIPSSSIERLSSHYLMYLKCVMFRDDTWETLMNGQVVGYVGVTNCSQFIVLEDLNYQFLWRK